MEDGAALKLETFTRSFVTLAFVDLCGSTELAQTLDPDVFAALLGAVGSATTTIVKEHGGLISQLYGDGALAVFRGAGGSDRALAATLAVHAAVRDMGPPLEAARAHLRMHSGIHAGLVLLRSGDAERGAIELIGRATGIAARLSAAAKPDEVLVSRGTLGQQGTAFRVGSVRFVRVSGDRDRIAAMPVMAAAQRSSDLIQSVQARRTPFYGRSKVIGTLAHALLEDPNNVSPCIAVVGPPGQGKSRLSEEFALRAVSLDVAVLRGSAAPSESASTLQPFREIDAAAARLLGEEPQPDDSENLSFLSEAVGDRLRRLAAQRRLILILDDWQWADSASLQLLNGLRRGSTAITILLLAREGDPGGLPLAADRVINLRPITETASLALVARLRPEFDLLDRQRVCRLAGGSPLYLEELCLLSARALAGIPSAAPNQDEIGRIAAIIEARVRALDHDLAEVLRVAAVIGSDCGVSMLLELCGLARDSPPLIRLQELDLLIPSLIPGNVRFKHGIARNVVYQLVHVEKRRELHRRVAELLERHAPRPGLDRDELLAWHLYESRQFGPAVVSAELAGDRAIALDSVDRAQLHYGRALQALDQLPGDGDYADRIRLVGKYGFVCIYDSDPGQLVVFERMAEEASVRGDRSGEAVARFWCGFVCHGSGQARRAIKELRYAANLSNVDLDKPVGVRPDSAFVAQLRATLAQALAASGRHSEAAPLLEEAIGVKLAHRTGRGVPAGTAYALVIKAAILGDTGRFSEARVVIGEALDLVGGRSHPVEASVRGWSAAVYCWQGDWQGMLEAAERGREVALRVETVYLHAINRAFAGYARWRLTGADAAAKELADAVACLADRGKELGLSIAYGGLADMAGTCGDNTAARSAVRNAYVRARAGDPFGLTVAARAWARSVAIRDPERARRMFLHARHWARRRGAAHELARCDFDEAAMGLVSPGTAAFQLSSAAAAFKRMGMADDALRADAFMAACGGRP